jgi:hypothetical protein
VTANLTAKRADDGGSSGHLRVATKGIGPAAVTSIGRSLNLRTLGVRFPPGSKPNFPHASPVLEKRRRCGGSIKPISIERTTVWQKQLLKPLLLIEEACTHRSQRDYAGQHGQVGPPPARRMVVARWTSAGSCGCTTVAPTAASSDLVSSTRARGLPR